MRIRYEITIEDLVAFNLYHCDHSPTVRRARLIFKGLYSIFFLAAVTVVAFIVEEPIISGSVLAGGVIGVLCVLLVPPPYRRKIERQVRKLFAEGANKTVFCPHELELVGGELVERTPFTESRRRLDVIERLVSDGGYTFIYVSALAAHIIPHDAVTEGNPEAFVESLKERLARESA